MSKPNRRDVLKTTGAGAGVAIGLGGTAGQTLGAQGGTTTVNQASGEVVTPEADITKAFEAVAEEGFIVIDGDSADDDPIEFGGDDIEGDVEIDGLVYADNTWQSTRVDFPDLDPAALLEGADVDLPIDPDDIEGDIEVHVEPIDGVYDAEEGLMTAEPISLTIDVDLTALGAVDIELEVDAEADLTTGESGEMEGDADNLAGDGDGDASATLVGNEFALEATGETIDPPLMDPIDIDEELGLPSPEGRNYLQITLDMEVTDVDGEPDEPIPLTTFTTETSEGFISFDTEDPMESRFEFGEDLDEEIIIDGTIYDDGTWTSDRVEIPPIDLEDEIIEAAEEAAPDWLPGVDLIVENLQYDVDIAFEAMEGEYRPHEDLFTGTLDVEIDIIAKIPDDAICDPTGIFGCWDPTLIDADVFPDPIDLTTHESNGPATEEGMEGYIDGIHSPAPEVNLVGQEFGVEAEVEDTTLRDWLVNSVLGTPSNAGYNWVDIDLDLELDDHTALEGELVFQPIVGESPPLDLNRDGLYEDVIGDDEFTSQDVSALFDHLHSDPVQEQTELFTFAGGLNRDRVGVVDVKALFNGGVGHWNPDELPDPPTVIVPEGEVDISLETPASVVEEGDIVEVDVVVSGATDGIEAFDLEVSLSDNEAAEIVDFDHGRDVAYDHSDIVDDGGRVVLEGATQYGQFDGQETTVLTTLELVGHQPGTTVSLSVDVGQFPQGIFGEDTTQYEVAETSGESLSVDFQADVAIEDQEAVGGQTIEVGWADPGENGAFVGIWSVTGDSADELLGTYDLGAVTEEMTVSLETRVTESQTLMAAVHPADEGADPGPNVETLLASDTASVDVSPPAIGGEGNPPQDLNGDGLYEDVNGDGRADVFDVQVLFNNMESEEVQEFAEFYNFAGQDSDEVGIFDVQSLFQSIQD